MVARDAGGFERPPLFVGHPLDLRLDRAAQRRRRFRRQSVERDERLPAMRGVGHVAALQQVFERDPDEQRVAASAFRDEVGKGRCRGGTVRPVGQQPGDRVGG